MKITSYISFASIFALVLSVAPFSGAQAFTDVSSKTQFSTAISAMKAKGVIEGYSDNTFKSGNTINRAEFLKIVLEGRNEGGNFSGSNCFPDIQDQWFAKYVCTASKEKIVQGYPDGLFKPDQAINFVEASKIIALAYKQDTNEVGGDWYKQYVKALEGSKAIPETIDSLERKITRGEMVEMMWRLSEGKTDQPTKGLLNIKHPEVSINTASDSVQVAKTCQDIRAFTEEANSNNQFGYADDMIAMPMLQRAVMNEAGAPMADSAEESISAGASTAKSLDFSDTNVQVQGVDEADIVKTDGTYIYMVRNSGVTVVKATPSNEMKVITEAAFTANTENTSELVADVAYPMPQAQERFNPEELYLAGDGKIVVIGNYWKQLPRPVPYGGIENKELVASASNDLLALRIAPGYYPSYSLNRTQVRIYSFSEANGLYLERTVSFDGNKISSRRIGDKLYLALNQGLNWNYPIPLAEVKEEDILPKFNDSAISTEDAPVSRCGNVVILPRVPNPQYLITATIPLNSNTAEVQREVIVGNGDNVYMSLNNLYIANTQWNYNWRGGNASSSEATDVYRFSIVDDGLEFKSQGSVPGRILNQFSMDEHNSSFRIATTKGQMWDESTPSTNNLYVLNLDMKQTGSIEGIAPGEQIYSVRFMGDKTYMVTFKKVDPFFVIDTSNPSNPRILGKLKIPGYSDYLHPYDDNHIIGFGKDAVESKDGNFAWYQGMKIALFDVTDVANPTLKHNIAIGDRGTSSPLLYNHKALLFDKERSLLAFPIDVHELSDEQKAKDKEGNAWGESVFQGAHVYSLTLDDGFKLKGAISHYTEEDKKKLGSYFYGKNIERILRIGESLFTISQGGVQSHSIDTISKKGGVNFSTKNSEYPELY